jgi:hypothetical protein
MLTQSPGPTFLVVSPTVIDPTPPLRLDRLRSLPYDSATGFSNLPSSQLCRGLLPSPDRAITGLFDCSRWKVSIGCLQLLKADHIWLRLLQPAQEFPQTAVDVVDIEGGYLHMPSTCYARLLLRNRIAMLLYKARCSSAHADRLCPVACSHSSERLIRLSALWSMPTTFSIATSSLCALASHGFTRGKLTLLDLV